MNSSKPGRPAEPSWSGRSGTGLPPVAPGDSGSGRAMAEPSSRLVAARSTLGPSDTDDAVKELDVWLLGVALERLFGIDEAAVAAGERVGYTKSVSEAIDRVAASDGKADAAFLLEPTPVSSITSVARSGQVMPQKSTYFYPKALTGLVINPHEW